MNEFDTGTLGDILAAESAALRRALENRGAATIESAAEDCEKMTLASQRELNMALADRTSRRLRDVEAALLRMGDGTFGECLDCEEQIPAKRLQAIPWASRCVPCQEAADRVAHPVDISEAAAPELPSPPSVRSGKTMKRARLAVTGALAAIGRLGNKGFGPTPVNGVVSGK